MAAVQSKNKEFDIINLAATILFGASYVLTPVVLHAYAVASFPRVLIAVVPLLTFILFLFRFNQSVKSQDELGRRVHLEATVLTVGVLVFLTVLKFSLGLAFPDWSPAKEIPTQVGWFPFVYIILIPIIRRRYS